MQHWKFFLKTDQIPFRLWCNIFPGPAEITVDCFTFIFRTWFGDSAMRFRSNVSNSLLSLQKKTTIDHLLLLFHRKKLKIFYRQRFYENRMQIFPVKIFVFTSRRSWRWILKILLDGTNPTISDSWGHRAQNISRLFALKKLKNYSRMILGLSGTSFLHLTEERNCQKPNCYKIPQSWAQNFLKLFIVLEDGL